MYVVGQLFRYPVCMVQQLAREIGVEGGVRTIAFGVEDDERHLTEVWQALRDCQESGGWLVLQNIHLARALTTSNVLHLLQVWMAW